ncbi:hypothetical protein GIB67_042096 [Kingdonia uniflora]|uniref:Peptidase A1 domain-containing protein n=1 Tax=Kingdonia uniflora TaxID=39325 RepID=A0A7J7MVT2_9MAGN|nr:hypothetical protein GIB67_042096 [Kingdonia uniflora]
MIPSCSFLALLSLLSHISSTTITIPLPLSLTNTNQFPKTPSLDILQQLTHLASTSLTRAKHLKNPNASSLTTTTTTTTTPLFPQNYGAYTIPLSFGTPSQTIQFIMDTGSSLVWFPCTHRYLCNKCDDNNNKTQTPVFIPKLSSSAKLIGCKNSKCGWIHDQFEGICDECEPNFTNCSQICPPYRIIYGSGSTGGILLSETLNLEEKTTENFVVGCSLFSSKTPNGIAGFGRRPPSLPSQLGLTKFSYCLLSHRFDDATNSGSLVLRSDSGDAKLNGVNYTHLLRNGFNTRNPAFENYYYIAIMKITVGVKHVKIPYSYLSRGSNGSGGTIVDSGATFTFMESRVFELVAREFEKQVASGYRRATDVETLTGLRLCYDISAENGTVLLPKIGFHFKGGAEMVLPLENYFSFVGSGMGVACMTVVTDVGGLSDGPSVILGNFQLQNYYVEYDLENERFGFRRQMCK